MSYTVMRRQLLVVGCVITLVVPVSLRAGPSFNPDRDELAKASEQAGAELHLGLQKVHEMLMYLELRDVARADAARAVALKHLQRSADLYDKVVEIAPNQRIVVKVTTQSEEASIQAFRERLRERKIDFPTTERELARLAVTAVREHADVLKDSKFKANKTDYERLRAVLRSQSLLLDLGILTSIAWTVSTRAR